MNKERLTELTLFSVSGVVGWLVDTLVTVLLVAFLGVYIARIPGFVAASTSTWLMNRSFTFKKRPSNHTSLYREYGHYVSLMLGGLIVNYLTYILLMISMQDSEWKIFIAIAAGCLAGLIVNYLSSRRYIFTGKKD